MDRIVFNDDAFQESYALNPSGVFSEDVGEWTMEEFFQEEESLINKIITPDTKIYQWFATRAAKQEREALEKQLDMAIHAPVTATVLNELKHWDAVPKFLGDVRLRIKVAEGALLAYAIVRRITQEIMFQQVWGRFPADLKSFYEYVFKIPQDLNQNDIKKLKAELKKLRKDTKWLTGKAGNEFITPKERQKVELMDEQLKDLLTWRMIPKDLNVQRTRRIHDRIAQFIETSHEFLNYIHDDMKQTKTKNTMKDAIK